ncbi:MAG: protoheme IX farnesyltransferase [Gammaproteobacteria bacterium]|nr:protoheme IX farnesyltransferase [Gammaproteobacteria bacterium]
MMQTLKLIYTTAKVRLGFLIMSCAIAGIAVSPGNGLSAWQVLVLAVGVLLSSASAGAFNQFYERDVDANMARTRDRPFVTGRFTADSYWLGGIVLVLLIGLAAAALATNILAAVYVFLGAFTYGVVYTVWLKRRTWLNIVVGGLAGSFAVMAGAAAVDSSLAPAPIILATVLFLWTPPHFWALALACKKDYAAAAIPMLPVVVSERTATWTILLHAVAVVLLSLTLVWYGMGWIYLLGAASGGAYFIAASIRLVNKPGVPQGWRTFAASIVQLGLLLTAAILDRLLLG